LLSDVVHTHLWNIPEHEFLMELPNNCPFKQYLSQEIFPLWINCLAAKLELPH
jgi:hypothetical protein